MQADEDETKVREQLRDLWRTRENQAIRRQRWSTGQARGIEDGVESSQHFLNFFDALPHGPCQAFAII